MNVDLISATIEDSEHLLNMQKLGFRALLEKYKDVATNPGAETMDKVKGRFSQNNVHQYFICLQQEKIGYIRIHSLGDGVYRLSQMFVLPAYQGRGFAQAAIELAERRHPEAKMWVLDTIKQETKLCHLYEKMGYTKTGVEKNIRDGMDLVDYAKEAQREVNVDGRLHHGPAKNRRP